MTMTKEQLKAQNEQLLKVVRLLQARNEHIDTIQKNYTGSFAISNYIENELLIKSYREKTNQIKVTSKDNVFYMLFENAYYLLNNKEYLTIDLDITKEKAVKGNGLGDTYTVQVDWSKIENPKRRNLNYIYNENIELINEKKYQEESELDELSSLVYQLTGRELTF